MKFKGLLALGGIGGGIAVWVFVILPLLADDVSTADVQFGGGDSYSNAGGAGGPGMGGASSGGWGRSGGAPGTAGARGVPGRPGAPGAAGGPGAPGGGPGAAAGGPGGTRNARGGTGGKDKGGWGPVGGQRTRRGVGGGPGAPGGLGVAGGPGGRPPGPGAPGHRGRNAGQRRIDPRTGLPIPGSGGRGSTGGTDGNGNPTAGTTVASGADTNFQDDAELDEEQTDPNAGTITGTVMTTEKEPVGGASCQWVPYPFAGYENDQPPQPVISEETGAYTMPGVPSGRPVVVQCSVADSPPGVSSNVLVRAGQISAGVDVVLTTAPGVGGITGRVVDEKHKPISGIGVSLLQEGSALPLLSTQTDVNGAYRFDQVPVGRRIVSVYLEAHRRRETQRVEVVAEEIIDSGEIVLPVGQGSLNGAVTNDEGRPVKGAEVTMHQVEGGQNRYRTFTNSSGQFEHEWMSEGAYRLEVRHHEHCDAQVELARAPGPSVDVVMSEGSTMSGRVAGDEGNVNKFRVVMHAKSGPDGATVQGTTAYRVKKHENGEFLVELRAGTWDIAAVTPDGMVGTARNQSVQCGSRLDNIEINVQRGARVSGRVIDATSGEPIKGARLTQTFGSAGLGPFSDGDYGGARSGDDGNFDITTVRGESFRLVVSAPKYKTRVISRQPEQEGFEIKLCHTAQSGCKP